jgi:hypothetical protein
MVSFGAGTFSSEQSLKKSKNSFNGLFQRYEIAYHAKPLVLNDIGKYITLKLMNSINPHTTIETTPTHPATG